MRTSMALAILLCSAASAFAGGDPAAGETAYATACARCHRTVARIAPLIEGTSAKEKATWLDTFLPRHHASDAQMRADLIAFLTAP